MLHCFLLGTFRPRNYSRLTAPHSTGTCEKCKYGRRPCWLTKQKPASSGQPGFNNTNLFPSNMTGPTLDNITSSMSSLSVSSSARSSPPTSPPFSPTDSPSFSPAVSPPMVHSPRPTHQPLMFPPSSGVFPAYYEYHPFNMYDFTGHGQVSKPAPFF